MGCYVTKLEFSNCPDTIRYNTFRNLCLNYGMEIALEWSCKHATVRTNAWIPSLTHLNKHKAFCYDLQQAGFNIRTDIRYEPYWINNLKCP